jgi:phage terminase small subunit
MAVKQKSKVKKAVKPIRHRPATAQMFNLADKYLECFNGLESALFAGYAKAGARNAAGRVLNHPEIIQYLKKQRRKIADKLEVSAERVLEEIAASAFANMQDYLLPTDGMFRFKLKPIKDLTRLQASAIQSLKPTDYGIEIKLNDKLSALDKLCRHLGLFKDPEFTINAESLAKLAPEMLEQIAEQLEAHFVGHTLH